MWYFRFAPWGSGSLNITQCRRSPYLPMTNRVSGLMLCNHTNAASLFQESLNQCETLLKKKAYLDQFLKVWIIFWTVLQKLYVYLLGKCRLLVMLRSLMNGRAGVVKFAHLVWQKWLFRKMRILCLCWLTRLNVSGKPCKLIEMQRSLIS